MVPFLVVSGLLLLGAAIVAWATRPTASYPAVQMLRGKQGQARGREAPGDRRTKPKLPAQPEAFASAPVSAPPTMASAASREARP